jgi:Protein of unknown function (DUF4019)
MYKRLLCLALSALPVLVSAAGPQEPTLPQMNQAKNWLELIDAGKYDQAWNEAGAPLQKKADLAKWTEDVKKARRSEAAVKCRKGLDFELLESPDGVNTLFLTEFADGRSISEKVTLLDGPSDSAQVTAYRAGPPLPDRGSACDQ